MYGRRRRKHLTERYLTRVSRQVSRAFTDLISTSPFLEYRLELFAAGLVENPHFSSSLEDGRRRVGEYVGLWENLDALERHDYTLRLRYFRWEELAPVGRGLLAGLSGRSISFIRVSCTTTGRRGVEEWTVDPPATPFWPCAFAVYPPEDVLALVEYRYP